MSYCEDILKTSKRLGITESEAVYSQKHIITIRITDSEIAEVKEVVEKGVSARLIQEKKIFSIKTSNLDTIAQDIGNNIKVTQYLRPKEFWKTLHQESPNVRKIEKTFDKKLKDIAGKDAADIAQSMINATLDDKITAISGSLNIVSDEFQIANSHGLEFEDSNTFISGVINADSKNEFITVSGIGQDCCRTLDGFDSSKIGQDAKNMCVESINPIKTESGEYSIIFEPYSVGEIMAFVFASNFNFKTVQEKKSCFTEKENQVIASEILNISDDPFVPDSIGAKSVDDEGHMTKKLDLIKDGVFKDTFSDLYDASKFDSQSTGNASRPGSPMGTSSEPNTIAAPHNIRIEGHTCNKNDMIKDIKKGIIVGRLWYTYAVNPIQGDFSCTARSGIQIIENGEIKNPGKPVRIVHNLKKLLENARNIADDAKNVQPWDSLPSIVPTMQFDEIRVNAI